MKKSEFAIIEAFMLECPVDVAHDCNHVYRVLGNAVDIARHEGGVDMDILIAACLLHDIGRPRQYADSSLCHAQVGAEMAYEFLVNHNWSEERANHVRSCITTHRYRKNNKPASIEAKILFDADKLEVAGAVGIARTILYDGQTGGGIDGFIYEYNFKLKHIYDRFYTARGKKLAKERQKTAVDFYNGLIGETELNDKNGYLED
ncbi:MAG: HD domain-containing protein [Defluviitaleaceae bacterium]|nr:HD domain-containing protein [Defluviitaleaceae bacterium]